MVIWKKVVCVVTANISVRRKGDTQLGTKVEVKNLNSIRNVKRDH